MSLFVTRARTLGRVRRQPLLRKCCDNPTVIRKVASWVSDWHWKSKERGHCPSLRREEEKWRVKKTRCKETGASRAKENVWVCVCWNGGVQKENLPSSMEMWYRREMRHVQWNFSVSCKSCKVNLKIAWMCFVWLFCYGNLEKDWRGVGKNETHMYVGEELISG